MLALAERAYFALCLMLGKLLRSAKYSKVSIDDRAGRVRKQRRFYGPLLVALSGPLVRILQVGVRVLPQRDWEERERQMYASLYGASIHLDARGRLLLHRLPGETLATLLENPATTPTHRQAAIEHAAVALAELHGRGFTHGDAMADNVMVDLEGACAAWFDFETIHDLSRSIEWRRADDLRALVATCLVRTAPDRFAETIQLMLKAYSGQDVTPLLIESFSSALRRPLAFHLGQAALSFRSFREIGRLLAGR